jgi:Lipocalin-like domain
MIHQAKFNPQLLDKQPLSERLAEIRPCFGVAGNAQSNLNVESAMNKALAAAGLGLALSGAAFAQQKSAKEQIVGAWTLVAVTSEMDDGNKGEPFGPSPKGVIIFSNDGYFSLFQSRAEIAKIAANDRAKATPEEAQSIVASSIAYYGTYSIDENTRVMMVNLAASTYANVAAIPNQKRTITMLTSDELKFDNPRTPNGMTLRTTWKRAAAP